MSSIVGAFLFILNLLLLVDIESNFLLLFCNSTYEITQILISFSNIVFSITFSPSSSPQVAVVSCPERSTVRTVRPPIRSTAVPTDRMATGRQRPLLPTGCSVSRDPSEYWLVDGTARHATLFGSFFFIYIYLFVMNLESSTLENVLS